MAKTSIRRPSFRIPFGRMHLLCVCDCLHRVLFVSLTVFINLHFEVESPLFCYADQTSFFPRIRETVWFCGRTLCCCCGLWHAKVFNKIGKFSIANQQQQQHQQARPTRTVCPQNQQNAQIKYSRNDFHLPAFVLCLPLFSFIFLVLFTPVSLSSISILLSSIFYAYFCNARSFPLCLCACTVHFEPNLI